MIHTYIHTSYRSASSHNRIATKKLLGCNVQQRPFCAVGCACLRAIVSPPLGQGTDEKRRNNPRQNQLKHQNLFCNPLGRGTGRNLWWWDAQTCTVDFDEEGLPQHAHSSRVLDFSITHGHPRGHSLCATAAVAVPLRLRSSKDPEL